MNYNRKINKVLFMIFLLIFIYLSHLTKYVFDNYNNYYCRFRITSPLSCVKYAKEKAGAKKRRMPAAFHYSFFSPVFTIGSSSVSSEADCVFSPDATASAAFFGGTIVRFSSPRSVQVLNIASFAHPGPISS